MAQGITSFVSMAALFQSKINYAYIGQFYLLTTLFHIMLTDLPICGYQNVAQK